MTQEEKQLLLVDLCARLPYDIICQIYDPQEDYDKDVFNAHLIQVDGWTACCYFWGCSETDPYDVEQVKPYLRPMSSMAEEEILELYKIAYTTWYSDSLYYKYEEWITFRDSIQNNAICFKSSIWLSDVNKVIDWLNAHHFDYRGLIEKGLAIEAPEDMYNTKTE